MLPLALMRTSESKDTRTHDSSAALNPKFATGLAASLGELRVRGTSGECADGAFGRRADGSDRADQPPRRFDLRAALGGAGARAFARLLPPGPARLAGRARVHGRAAAQGGRPRGRPLQPGGNSARRANLLRRRAAAPGDRKSTRLNSS